MGFTGSYIQVKTTFAGIHAWAECHLSEVQWLKNDHRHIFHVSLVLPVNHDDRDLEFFVVKAQIDTIVTNLYCRNGFTGITHLGQRSCEMVAKDIINGFLALKAYKHLDWIRCTVSEDDENGAGVMWEKGA
jgi:hypothetical protein